LALISQEDRMKSLRGLGFGLAVAALCGFALVTSNTGAFAVGADSPSDVKPPAPPQTNKSTTTSTKKHKKKPQSSSQLEWINRFWAAHKMIVERGEYEAGIKALRALNSDDHPDVATYIGYASRKLGRYDDAKYWYDKALAADPTHTRTIAYYGMWHLEQGNRLKAEDELAQISDICGGTSCRDYKLLKAAIDGHLMY
jgi:tetratricopeptide (TPR) repeat protein